MFCFGFCMIMSGIYHISSYHYLHILAHSLSWIKCIVINIEKNKCQESYCLVRFSKHASAWSIAHPCVKQSSQSFVSLEYIGYMELLYVKNSCYVFFSMIFYLYQYTRLTSLRDNRNETHTSKIRLTHKNRVYTFYMRIAFGYVWRE